ncbi:TraB/GumN family protein [Candidatus Methylocalor cossyra]|uniref:TraB family protein n=1 Tax=Candidatus Methylocalor cossyra TaxID=3108543 RepID=A0ABM9NHH2_9GAMM
MTSSTALAARIPAWAAVLTMAFGPALADVHKCLDAQRKVIYQDKPCQELTTAELSPALSQLNPEAQHPHLLWKLNSNNKAFYLLASLSFGTNGMYPLPESIMDAFSSSSVLVIANELDNADGLPVTGRYADGSTLQSHVKPATWRRTLEVAKALGVAEEALAPQKPWRAALTLKNAAIHKAGYDSQLTLGATFVKAAGSVKPIVELNSLEEQAKHYDGMTDSEQETLLLEALYAADPRTGYFQSLLDAWRQGDGAALVLAARRASNLLPPSQKPATDWEKARNAALAGKIDEMAADGRVYFVVIDAKRVVGEDGILALLQQKGFKAVQQ